MGLREIRHQVGKLCWRLLVGTVERVPEWNQICEFDCRATACDWEKWESCERRLGVSAEVHGQVAAAFVSMQRKADSPSGACDAATERLSASDIVRGALGPNSSATISNVLVLGTEGAAPLKRMEIRFGDSKEVPGTLNSLAAALQRSGIDFRAVRNPAMPATEIWLTSPLHDGNKTLLFYAAAAGEQVA